MKKLYIIVLCFLFSCDVYDSRYITIFNKSNCYLYAFISNENTKIKVLKPPFIAGVDIKEKDFGDIGLYGRTRWEDYIKTCDNEKIRLYIIVKDSVDKYGWEAINAKNIYNKKYELTIDDLDSINWEITYK